MRAVSSSVLPPRFQRQPAQAVGHEQDDLGVRSVRAVRGSGRECSCGRVYAPRIVTYSIRMPNSAAPRPGHARHGSGTDAMQLPDETIAYQLPAAARPARRTRGRRSPSCRPSTSSPPERLDAIKNDADRRPRPGRRRARAAATPPAKDPAAPGRLHRPAAEAARRSSAASRTPANSARSSASPTGCARTCDRVVVLGIGGSYLGAKALFDALCHTYHNELPAKLRMGKPRIYFEGNNVDNDALQDLLELLENTCVDPDIAGGALGRRSSSASPAARSRPPPRYRAVRGRGRPSSTARSRDVLPQLHRRRSPARRASSATCARPTASPTTTS